MHHIFIDDVVIRDKLTAAATNIWLLRLFI
jgi:hypothetical protein